MRHKNTAKGEGDTTIIIIIIIINRQQEQLMERWTDILAGRWVEAPGWISHSNFLKRQTQRGDKDKSVTATPGTCSMLFFMLFVGRWLLALLRAWQGRWPGRWLKSKWQIADGRLPSNENEKKQTANTKQQTANGGN